MMITYDLSNQTLEQLYRIRDVMDIDIAERMKEMKRIKKAIARAEETGKNLSHVVDIVYPADREWKYPAH